MKRSMLAGLAAAAALLPTLLAPPAPVRADDTVTFGLIQPLTGQGAEVGQGIVKGIDLALDRINASGGVLGGKKLKYVLEDDQCTPPVTVSAAKKLIGEENLKIVMGAMCSSTTLAIIPVTQAAKVLLVVPQSYHPQITERGDPYLFRTCITSDGIADVYSDFIAHKQNVKTIALLGVNDDFGRAELAAFTQRFEKIGHPKVLMTEYFRFQDRDFSTYLTRIREANPEAIYILARTPQNAMIVNQMAEMRYKPRMFGNSNFTDQNFVDLTKGNAEGIYSITDYSQFLDTPTNKAFFAAYRAKYNQDPSSDYASAGYNAANALAYAIEHAGTATDVDKLAEAFHKAKVPINSGVETFDAHGQGSILPFLVQLRGGVYYPLKAAAE